MRGASAAANPAGSIAASSNDMARWISVQLAAGKIPASKSDAISRDLQTVIRSLGGNVGFVVPHRLVDGYGLTEGGPFTLTVTSP